MIALDSNILVRHASPKDPLCSIAKAALGILRSDRRSLHLVPQNLYEFWVVGTRPVTVNGLGLIPGSTRIKTPVFTGFLMF